MVVVSVCIAAGGGRSWRDVETQQQWRNASPEILVSRILSVPSKIQVSVAMGACAVRFYIDGDRHSTGIVLAAMPPATR